MSKTETTTAADDPRTKLAFSTRQGRTISVAITTVAALVILAAVCAIAWLVAVFLQSFSSVFLPVALGAVGALVFRPYYDLLHTRLHLPVILTVVVIFVTVIAPVVAFLWFFGSMLVSQLVSLVSHGPEWFHQGRLWLEQELPHIKELLGSSGVGDQIEGAIRGQQQTIVDALKSLGPAALDAGLGVLGKVGDLLAWVVLPVYFAYFLTVPGVRLDADRFLPFFKPDVRKDIEYMVQEFLNIIVAFFRGQLIIALLQGLLFAVGFTLVGLQYGFVLGLVLGFLNIIPYLGSMVGLAITVPLSLVQPGGGAQLCILTLVVFVVVQQIESWILTPKIMGDRTGLHFIAIMIAIFFWGAALGGILGMILAIPLTAFLASMWRLAREKYIPEAA